MRTKKTDAKYMYQTKSFCFLIIFQNDDCVTMLHMDEKEKPLHNHVFRGSLTCIL